MANDSVPSYEGISCLPVDFEKVEMPTLIEASLLAIAQQLWESSDVVSQVKSFYRLYLPVEINIEQWKFATLKFEMVVTNYVLKNSLCLRLPPKLLEGLDIVVKQLGRNVWMWLWNFAVCLFCKHRDRIVDYLGMAHLTLRGKIDSLKMLELILEDEAIDIFCRYDVACKFCLETIVWELSAKILKNYSKIKVMLNMPFGSFYFTYWNNCMKLMQNPWQVSNVHLEFDIQHKEMFKKSAQFKYVSAVRFFWSKLTAGEKESYLMPVTISTLFQRLDINHSVDTLCFLLSQMDAAQQMSILENYTLLLAENFLIDKTVSLNYLLSIHPNIFNNMTISQKKYFVCLILGSFHVNNESFFEELWFHAPWFKREILSKFDEFIMTFTRCGSTRCMKMLLHDVSMDRKHSFMYSDNGLIACELLIDYNKFALLGEFMWETLGTEESVKAYKKRIIEKYGALFYKIIKNVSNRDAIANLCELFFSTKIEKDNFLTSVNAYK